jgi:hypothetical protein
MRLVLKEKQQKLDEDLSRPELVMMRATDFLKLTTTPETYAMIKRDIEKPGYFDGQEFDRNKIETLFLKIDKSGKVIGHEGRHRSMAAIKAEGPDTRVPVNIGGDKDSEYFLTPQTLTGQFDSSVKIDTESQFSWVPVKEENVLNINPLWGAKFVGGNFVDNISRFFYDKFESSAMDEKEFLNLVNDRYKMENEAGDMLALGRDEEGFFLANDYGLEENYAIIKLRKKRK